MSAGGGLLSASQQSAVARLFSATVLQEMARKGRSPTFARLVRQSSLVELANPAGLVRDTFELAFLLLRRRAYRHEYVYKTALTHKVLLGAHSLRTAAMLTEFRVAACKADVAILNGTSTVYEIKSERDSLERLESQIAAYRRVFAQVNVITGENHLDAVMEVVPDDVGVLLLNHRYNISTIRDAENVPERVEPDEVFKSIQLVEAKKIIELNGIEVPDVPNTLMHRALRERFNELSPEKAHFGMVRVLKQTRSLLPLSDVISALPESLRAAAISTPMRKCDHARLIATVNLPIYEALNWD